MSVIRAPTLPLASDVSAFFRPPRSKRKERRRSVIAAYIHGKVAMDGGSQLRK